ncbi:hypothetical protein [Herbaspirillum frisingense]|uniref:hypothetical protein n=1 Tax=Herbaspirillum frisingense TaxID=92645 RepID=UPI001F47DDC6|nr:hypothetical protein [Herbaspirillum frisingense]UIN21487.1 hypothetical protein LAZ82_24140 [Herbaspirillum frisingense]
MKTSANETIVVRATTREKLVISAKARRLGLEVPDLMCKGALAYEGGQMDEALGELASQARQAAERACAAIDETLDFVAASNARLAALEAQRQVSAARS